MVHSARATTILLPFFSFITKKERKKKASGIETSAKIDDNRSTTNQITVFEEIRRSWPIEIHLNTKLLFFDEKRTDLFGTDITDMREEARFAFIFDQYEY